MADNCVTALTPGDLLSSDGGNTIPAMAIVFAVVSSFNSVGVSVYQEQLFKVCLKCESTCQEKALIIGAFSVIVKTDGSNCYSVRQNSGENFLEQQFWLYLYGVAVALMVHLVSSPTALLPAAILHQLTAASATTQLFLALGLLFSSVGGLVVAAILKKLDNVVKVQNLQPLSVIKNLLMLNCLFSAPRSTVLPQPTCSRRCCVPASSQTSSG